MRDLSAAQARKLLTGVRPRDVRNRTEGRAYDDRKIAAGKSSNEAMRCRKRRLSDIVYRTMLNDLVAKRGDRPGRTPGHVASIQRGRLTSPHRPFGQVTSRTRQGQA